MGVSKIRGTLLGVLRMRIKSIVGSILKIGVPLFWGTTVSVKHDSSKMAEAAEM